jgi:membrane-bound lytic murein transglycosylase D
MVPMAGQAKAMTAMFDKKVALKNAQGGTESSTQIVEPAAVVTDAPKARTTYRVAKGDTLHSISSRTGATVQALRDLNQLKGNTLKVGQQLTLIAAANDAPVVVAEANTGKASRVVAAAPKRAIKPVLYTVRNGDTLFAIANKFNVPMDNLVRWNRLKSKSVLAVGHRLKVSA